jgi:mono/diheme cytochrome c family protein
MRLPLLFIVSLFIGCGPGSGHKTYESLNDVEQTKFEKYLIQGKEIYNNGCVNCHQQNGAGLKKLIPPLAKSDYLENNQQDIVCLIKYGAKAPISVHGITYQPTMPAHPQLTDLEIAEVITYINNSWGNELGFVGARKVTLWSKQCSKQ